VAKRELVTFLSDYGLEDEFVGVCHGVMLRIAPWLRIIDVHHYILRQDIRHGSIVLEQSVRYLPEGVHLAVVDPSVGSKRRAVVIECNSERVFVGPDNGLLMGAAEASGGIARAFDIRNEALLLTPISRTFQGRDVFAPAAAHIAAGVDPSELGPKLAADKLTRLELSEAWVHDDHLHAEVLQVDRFGNLQFNFDSAHLDRVNVTPNEVMEIRMEGHRLNVPFGDTFADVEAGHFVLVEDSYRHMSLAINKGDAAHKLQARAGSTAIVGPARH
jgi:S-adenosylmethionine hydrolase